MTIPFKSLAIPLAFTCMACGGDGARDASVENAEAEEGNRNGMPTEPTGSVTVEGRIEAGVECPIIRTPDGETWAIAMGEADFGPGDYVRITGETADTSFCQQGRGTLEPSRIDAIAPPAGNRDPARAGGVALTEDYLTGSWVAKGVEADCADPDFSIRRSPGALVLEADISDHDNDAMVVLGNYPRIDLDEPKQDLPMESRGPDGVAILRPATDAAYDPVRIGSARITDDGVVFVKCRR